MKQAVSIFRSDQRIALYPESQTSLRVWMATAPFESLGPNADFEEIGDVALRLLQLSLQGVPHPPDLHKRAMSESFFAALGLESGRYPMALRSCSVVREAGVISFTPMRHKGRGSFVAIGDARFTLDTDEPQAVGQAVLRCLDACR